MRLAIDALSCTNLSGRQVLLGHLEELCRAADPLDQLLLIHHVQNRDIVGSLSAVARGVLASRVAFLEAPAWTAGWMGRAVYERFRLPRVLRDFRASALLLLSGLSLPDMPCPQITLALNPWAMTVRRSDPMRARVKAHIQRRAYGRAWAQADGIGFGSRYMESLYAALSNNRGARTAIVYPALARAETDRMDLVAANPPARDRRRILCVSLMARHKRIETLIEACSQLVHRRGVDAVMDLAGGWVEPAYRRAIEQQIADAGLTSRIRITGHLSREALLQAYAGARVYALLSRSESFGIPSVEAQWMGTPVVGATGSAMPEICGAGGWFCAPDDVNAAVQYLETALTDDVEWARRSEQARQNARRYQYALTTPVLRDLIRAAGGG